MTARECPAWRRDRPLWAEMLGAPDRPRTEWAGDRTIALFPAGSLAAQPARAYLLGSGVVDADYLGEWNGHAAWLLPGDRILFHSASRGKWVLKDDFLEPVFWTRTLLKADGTTEEAAYGDTWWEAYSLAIDGNGEVEFACAGKDAKDAEIAGDDPPDPEVVEIGGKVWLKGNASAGVVGDDYSPVAGTGATGTARVGFWTWRVGGAVWAMDPGDRTEVVSAATGAATECQQGKWTVRAGSGGKWVADLSEAEYGDDLKPYWAPDAGAQAVGDAPEVEWAGLAAAPALDPVYVYQPSRFL